MPHDWSIVGLKADRTNIKAEGQDLSFITVSILDENGNINPRADNLVEFEIEGPGKIVGVNNSNPVSHESFKAPRRKAFNGLCLVVIQSLKKGEIMLKAKSEGLEHSSVAIVLNKY